MTQHFRKVTTLVVGGTGKTGTEVVKGLRAIGQSVGVTSRQGDPAFDWNAPSNWPEVVGNAEQLYISYAPDLALPTAAPQIAELVRIAVAQGTRRIVLLSGRGEPECEPAERAVRESGAAWTILRCSWFNQNFSDGALLPAVLSGTVRMPAGEVREPFIDTRDIADCAIVALSQPGHDAATYELTGPRLLGFADAAREISSASGTPLRYQAVSVAEYASDLAEYFPKDLGEWLAALFNRVLDGRNAQTTPDVQRLLGRQARDFSAFAKETAARGVWRGEAAE
ncbi:MAG: NmrA family transcriptional regulator [Polyangiaceae bacterium]|nr:hypothetical protein [Myxococcales bacterium]MCB9590746.1 NmrA family transcriptional regulator [Polyangiaceae bacterium]